MVQEVNLVYEQDIVGFEVGQDSREVAAALDGGSRCYFDAHPHLHRDDVGQGSLAQARRAVENDVVQGFTPPLRRLDGDAQVLLDAVLADEVLEAVRAQAEIERGVFDAGLAGNNAGDGRTSESNHTLFYNK